MMRDTFPSRIEQADVLCRLYDRYPPEWRRAIRAPLAAHLERVAGQLRANRYGRESARLLRALMRRDGATPRRLVNWLRAVVAATLATRGPHRAIPS
jgi:hypothetical protein